MSIEKKKNRDKSDWNITFRRKGSLEKSSLQVTNQRLAAPAVRTDSDQKQKGEKGIFLSPEVTLHHQNLKLHSSNDA